ncbi:MAG: ATP-dependent DNA helicase RecQ, partial [Microgenomates bacterium 39_7]
DFRPSYTRIPLFINKLAARPIVAAFTATATPLIADDIINCLELKSPTVFKQSSLRTNLQLNIIHCHNKASKQLLLLKILKKHSQESGIIYCSTRKATEQVASLINQLNLNNQLTQKKVLAYHGGLDSQQRESIQQRFMKNEVRLISATNAFGMGVDKSDVRFVIHYQLSANIENYYQEVGRAGRDGEQSYCYLLFEERDAYIQRRMISQTSADRIKIEQKKLNTFLEMVYSDTCLQKQLATYFGDELAEVCGNCSNCRSLDISFSAEEKTLWNLINQNELLMKLPEQLKLFITLLNPQTEEEWLKIPGVGAGLWKIIKELSAFGHLDTQ